ncbi:MAG: hypothetical protein GVY20_13910 [Bacteroidetes bacterium]|jgi:hypothetical protein|nr:hypothetical protein [Bacteroidota bacterium]
MRSIKKRLERIERPYKPKSIFADWCHSRAMAKGETWKGTDQSAFSEWLDFQMNATDEERENLELAFPVEFTGSLHGTVN